MSDHLIDERAEREVAVRARIRAELLQAVDRDLSRTRPRRPVVTKPVRRLAVATVVVVGATGVGTAAANDGWRARWFGPPASSLAQAQLDGLGLHAIWGPTGTVPLGQPIELARDGDLVLEGAIGADGRFCVMPSTGGVSCALDPGPPGIVQVSIEFGEALSGIEGKPDQAFNATVTGWVDQPAATSVDIALPDGSTRHVAVGPQGFFVASIAEGPFHMASKDHPIGPVVARDAQGGEVARSAENFLGTPPTSKQPNG